MEKSQQRFLPALEGVRGYAFIAVFLVHYLSLDGKPVHPLAYLWSLMTSLAWLAVPLFFAVSGYLITRILYRSKDREGFFRVFYGRRVLRVFPLYYLVIGSVLLTAVLLHKKTEPQTLLYFLYLQNLWCPDHIFGCHFPFRYWVDIDHLWSLAVEEQFYILWPVVIWMCRTRKSMLRVSYGVLAGCFLIRLGWPLLHVFHIPMVNAYYSTWTRVDGIVCGAIVALWSEGGELPKMATRVSYWIASVGVTVLVCRAVVCGYSVPVERFNVALMMPVSNCICTAILVLLLAEHTWVSRACSQSWICKLGRLSYALYIFHFLYLKTFKDILPKHLAPVTGGLWAQVIASAAAFLVTWILASLSFHLIEAPALRAKVLFQYGGTAARPGKRREAIWARAFRHEPGVLSQRI
jgi:peptidoglycan/LPS O-acetylase OafA/YrhL